ncbi:MAG TPA: pilus assembly protein [Oligoflexia bacterium]|nr:pilus assembly protein [Oligoflexia bacterium]HMP48878.1 pilus assembly protein [Oligoflexia bacterium]
MISGNQKGGILVEASLSAPILIMIFFVCTDFLLYTKSFTYAEQVTRDAALFMATTPGALKNVTLAMNKDDSNNSHIEEIGQICKSLPDEIYSNNGLCIHALTLLRIRNMIRSHGNQLKSDEFIATAAYDGTNVSVQIQVYPRVIFGVYGFFNKEQKIIRKTSTLKRIFLF